MTYARRMIALRDEAWAAVVRPDVTGRVVIGVSDDYASSLFPPILKKFSATYPKVEIQVAGLPSLALVPMLRDGSVDLVCATRVKGLSGEFLRHEPMIWAAAPGATDIWRERPFADRPYFFRATSRARTRFAAWSAHRVSHIVRESELARSVDDGRSGPRRHTAHEMRGAGAFHAIGSGAGLAGNRLAGSGAGAKRRVESPAVRFSGRTHHGRVASLIAASIMRMRFSVQLRTSAFDAISGIDTAMMR